MDDTDRGTDGTEGGELVGGGPTTVVSQEGIDEAFEKLERRIADSSVPTADADEPTGDDAFDAESERADAAADRGSADADAAAGVRDDGRDSRESAGGASSADEFGALSGGGPDRTVSGTSADDILDRIGDDVEYATFGDDAVEGVGDVDVDPEAVLPDGDAPLPDEHTPPEDADDLRPDDADGEMLGLLGGEPDDVGEPEADAAAGIDPDEPSAAAESDAGASVVSVDELEDGGRVALNAPDDEGIEWSDAGGAQADADVEDGTDPAPAERRTENRGGSDGGPPARPGYVRRAVGRIRSLLARLV